MRQAFLTVIIFVALIPVARAGDKVKLSHETCRIMSMHVAEDGVAFQPRVGVNGQSVAPADLGGGSPINAPESYSINILDLMGARVENPTAPGDYVPEARMGVIEVTGGKLTYNGQELPDSAVRAIAEACRTLP